MANQTASNDSVVDSKSNEPIEQLPKRQRIVIDWKQERTFHSELELAQFFEKESHWSYYYENNPKVGRKVYYRCKLNKVRSEPCKSRIYTLHRRASKDIILFRNYAAHTHENS